MKIFAETISRLYKHRRFNLIAFGIISMMVLLAYSNTFTASFHFDDNPAIIENPNIRHVTVDNLLNILKGSRFVVNLSIMLNYQLGGVNVVGYHIFNIGVHIINSCFVYILIVWTLNLPVFHDRYRESAMRMALFAALLFGVHPLQTESVTYIITRTELLATFFYLATFLLYIKGYQQKGVGYYIAAAITAALAMGSKEWAVTIPALLIIYDFLFLSEGKLRPLASKTAFYIVVCLSWIIVLRNLNLFATGGTSGIGFNVASATGLSAKTYFLTSLNVIWTYVRLLFLPINQNLDYDYAIAKTLFEFPTFLSLLGHIAVFAAAFWFYTKRDWKLIPFGVAWFYIGLSPTQSFVPIIDVIFEHRVYMPSIGFFIVFVTVYEKFFEWLEQRKAARTSIEART